MTGGEILERIILKDGKWFRRTYKETYFESSFESNVSSGVGIDLISEEEIEMPTCVFALNRMPEEDKIKMIKDAEEAAEHAHIWFWNQIGQPEMIEKLYEFRPQNFQ